MEIYNDAASALWVEIIGTTYSNLFSHLISSQPALIAVGCFKSRHINLIKVSQPLIQRSSWPGSGLTGSKWTVLTIVLKWLLDFYACVQNSSAHWKSVHNGSIILQTILKGGALSSFHMTITCANKNTIKLTSNKPDQHRLSSSLFDRDMCWGAYVPFVLYLFLSKSEQCIYCVFLYICSL